MSSALDTEKDGFVTRELTNFASLAAFIAEDLDHTAVIFKRFGRLAARNLLYLQSELAALQALQDEYDREDLRNAVVANDYQALGKAGRDWPAFVKRAQCDEKFKQRMQLAESVREKMKQYRRFIKNRSSPY